MKGPIMSDATNSGNSSANQTPPPPAPAPGQPAYGQPTPPPAYGQPAPQPPAYSQAPAGYPAYGAPAYPAAPAYGAPAGAKTNTLAIVSLIASISGFIILPFIGSIVGIITGHMSLSQIKRTGEGGRGMGLAGTIVGWVGLALAIIGTIIFFAWISWFVTNYGDYSSI